VRVAIAGAGGVGGLLAGLLARAGTQVSLLARGEHLRSIRENGIRVETPEGAVTARVDASDSPADLPPAQALIVAVKTWQLPAALPGLGALLEPSGVAVPLLNGVEAADVLAASLGKERVCGGLCHVFAWIEAPGVIRRAGIPPRVTMGELFGHGREKLEELCAALRAAGAGCSVSAEIRTALWEKLLFVGPLGAVGAAARVAAGRLRSIGETRALLDRAMREVQAVAHASGASIADAAVASAMARVDALPPEGTTSMHRDLLAGRRSELDDLVGAVLRAAAGRVPVPAHEALYALLWPHELAARESR